jgi:outer membrane protein TolC
MSLSKQLRLLSQCCGAAFTVALLALAAGCGSIGTTEKLSAEEREQLAADARRQMFEGQEAVERPLTLAEATARAIKYQADHRQKRMEEAAAAAQLEVARFDLLPRITANAGYNWRNNDSFGFGFSPDGTISSNPTASVERIYSTGGVGLAWNVLDFGTAYFRARQLSDQKLIVEERRRKAVQTLMHDVRVAWYRAEAAQRLLPATDLLLVEIEQAIEKTRVIEAGKLLPPVQTATLRRALLDLAQQIAMRRQDLAQSRVELATLINTPPGVEYRIVGVDESREVLDLTADVEGLELMALRNRPELAEEGYRARISRDEARKAMVGLIPNVTLDVGRNFDANKFLLNNTWTSVGVRVALNLVKVFSIPAQQRSEEAQKAADDARRQAMAMAVLAQTHLAAVRYSLVADEYMVWAEAVRDDDLIVRHLASSESAGVDNELELIRARARALASRINRDLSYANLQASIARLYNSVGYDAVPQTEQARAVDELTQLIEARFDELEHASFSKRAAVAKPTVAAGLVSGGQPRILKLVQQGMGKALETAGFASSDSADVRLELRLALDPAKEGVRSVRVAVSALPRGSSTPTLSREFRTTLSEPVDDEQWRALGEGAVYKVATDLATRRITQPSLRVATKLSSPSSPKNAKPAPRPHKAAPPTGEVVALPLRLDGALDATALRAGAGQ